MHERQQSNNNVSAHAHTHVDTHSGARTLRQDQDESRLLIAQIYPKWLPRQAANL